MIDWHRLFGLALTDYFADSPYRVELEKDLSLKQQFLDVIIIENQSDLLLKEVPDGLEHLTTYNLLTYKSRQEALDSWTLDELIGHYVNYRKQISPSRKHLWPVEAFRLYAVCTRNPHKLKRELTLDAVSRGVYDVQWGVHRIRIIVLSQIPRVKRNALWHLFSGIQRNVQYGAARYGWRQTDHSTLINELYRKYQTEGVVMSYTFEDFYRDIAIEHFRSLSREEQIEEIANLQLWKDLPVEKFLKKIPMEERLKDIPVEERLKDIPVEERLKDIPVEDIEAMLKKYLRRPQKKRKKISIRSKRRNNAVTV